MAVQLTEGAIEMISSGKWQPADVKPVLQVIELRAVPSQTADVSGGEKQERYRLMLSDGLFFQQAMLATQRNELVKSQQMQKGSVVQLKEYVCNFIRDRPILIVIDLDVIMATCDVIGDAKPFPLRSGNEPPISRSPSPMQPSNQPATTMGIPQTYMGGSVPRPANSPIYPPHQDHNTSLHSYGNPLSTHSVAAVSHPPTNSYVRPIQPTYNQPPPMYANRGPMAKNEAPARIIPIAALNPYQGRWTIKARVTSKAELRRYNNAKGDGKVFSFDLLDSDGGEIRVTCFNAVADQFYDQIEIGKVYFISKGSVKPAAKAFNHLKNDHEILLDTTSTIQPCVDDDNSIPHQQFHFRSIADIEGLENNSVLDIIGVVSSITPTSTLMRKNGTETQKRTLQLKDMSGRSVEVTLWGNFCSTEGQTLQNMCDSGVFPVLAVKSARVSDFNGKSVGTISTSQLCIEPDFPEARKLKTWFESVGKITPSVSLSRDAISRTDVRKTISQIKDEKLGTSEKPDWITVNGTIWHLRVENFCYTACPIMNGDRQCSKKVTRNEEGIWKCDKCDKVVDECEYRYILQFQIQDHTGSTWVTAFQESGEEIMGVSAKDLYHMKNEEQDEEEFTKAVRKVLFSRYNFKLKVKEETFSDEQRVKSTVVKAEKIKNLSSETTFLLDLLKKEDAVSVGIGQPKVEMAIPSYGGNGIKDSGGFSGVGQYGNQYGGGGSSSISRVGSSCNSCGRVGHNSANCPSGYNSQGQGQGQGGRFNSVVSGVGTSHAPSPSAYGGGTSGGSNLCFKCNQPGHWARDCPATGGGNGNVATGRYGGVSGQYVGGY
ncbi:unnamed protein product [Lactuca saligna]|uniref:Replication protein A subunit n=1 Tax=Lactuca saligna TaxID=75948 RepID=A0AA35YJG0_LACSI|nr:unnamed protein product [Lactuca saligna]